MKLPIRTGFGAYTFILLLAYMVACAPQSAPPGRETSTGDVVAVHVTTGGVITMNGREVSLEEVKQEFARLGKVGGTLRYSRDNPTADPHPNAMEVIKAAADANLKIQMAAK